jgi:hypothetical protein
MAFENFHFIVRFFKFRGHVILYSTVFVAYFFFVIRCVYFFRLRSELEAYETKIAESTKRLR